MYRRSPMFERLRLQKERAKKEGFQYQYQDIAQLEERNIQVFGGQIEVPLFHIMQLILLCEMRGTNQMLPPRLCLCCQMDATPAEIYHGSGHFTRAEMLNLREALDDRKTMEKIKVLREARLQLAHLTHAHAADRQWQLGELSDTQVRLKGAVRTLGAQARELSTLVKEHGRHAL
jgi:hypothetical protein